MPYWTGLTCHIGVNMAPSADSPDAEDASTTMQHEKVQWQW